MNWTVVYLVFSVFCLSAPGSVILRASSQIIIAGAKVLDVGDDGQCPSVEEGEGARNEIDQIVNSLLADVSSLATIASTTTSSATAMSTTIDSVTAMPTSSITTSVPITPSVTSASMSATASVTITSSESTISLPTTASLASKLTAASVTSMPTVASAISTPTISSVASTPTTASVTSVPTTALAASVPTTASVTSVPTIAISMPAVAFPASTSITASAPSSILTTVSITSMPTAASVTIVPTVTPTYTCSGTPGWRRIAFINMTDTSYNCPTGLNLTSYSKRTCGRSHTNDGGCSSTTFSIQGLRYSRVCGRIRGYQFGRTGAFRSSNRGINSYYVEGVSLTHGASGRRQHIWTFASGRTEVSELPTELTCPCNTASARAAPAFVGNDYFCESGVHSEWFDSQHKGVFFSDDVLWDGQNCTSTSTCCQFNNPPWFTKNLPIATVDDIELRICTNGPIMIDDVPIELIELYVQ